MALFFSLLAPLFFAAVNHLDKYLVERQFNKSDIGALIIFSCLVGLPFGVGAYVLSNNVWAIDPQTRLILALDGALYGLALVPYLKALSQEETSTVTPFFLLTPVLGSILAFLLLHEILSTGQLVGASLTVFGSLGLASGTLAISEWKSTLKLKLWLLMLAASFLMAANATLYKFAAEDIEFTGSIFWQMGGLFSMGVLYLIGIAPFRHQFLQYVRQASTFKIWALNSINECLAFFGQLALYYATLLSPVGLVLWISESFQPVYVLGISLLLAKFFPHYTSERLAADTAIKKFLFISMMAGGSYLMK